MTYWKLERPSKRSGKKWQVRVPTSSGRGKTVAFGDAKMSDYTLHKDKARRDNYRTRHQHDRIDDPYAPGFWSWWSLWGESSDLDKAHAAAVKRAKKILGVTTNEEGNEVATKSPTKPRRNPNPPGTPTPTMAEVAEVVAVLDVPKHLRAEFLKGFATEWEHAHTVGYDLVMVGSIVLDHLAEDAHYYRKLRRARLNPSDDTAPSNRVQACFDALLSLVQEQYPSLSCTIEVDEAAGERGGKACTRAYAFCEDLDDGSFRIAVAGKMNDASTTDDSRVEGLLRHELAHAVLLHGGDLEHTERDADEVAEALFGSPLYYDEDDVQTTDPSAPGARRPRPAYLDDEQGRTLDAAEPAPYDRHVTASRNPAMPHAHHQLETVDDVASCLDDCAAKGDAKTPRMLASQFSQQAKAVAGAQARMLTTLAKAARHCANGIEARLGGEVDRALASERLCERALADAQSPSRKNPRRPSRGAHTLGTILPTRKSLREGDKYAAEVQQQKKTVAEKNLSEYEHRRVGGEDRYYASPDSEGRVFYAIVDNRGIIRWFLTTPDGDYPEGSAAFGRGRTNPEWAKKLGSGLYKGARYAGETARDLYHGAREAHRAASERKNPRGARRAGGARMLPGIGRLTITPDPEGARDRASVEVTKAFADEWDHGGSRTQLMHDVMDAAEKHRGDSNFYAVALKYKGREFFKAYPRGAGF